MTKAEIERVQSYLRRLLGSERIHIVAPKRAGMSVEVAVDEEVVGMLHRDVEEGEVSYAVHLTILEEDLPPGRAAVATRSGTDVRSPKAPKLGGTGVVARGRTLLETGWVGGR